MKKGKPKFKFKVIMTDGYTRKITSFAAEDVNGEDITQVRTWFNTTHPFVNIGNDHILNLRYVKRIKRIWRLRDHLPKWKMNIRSAFVLLILGLIAMGYLFIVLSVFLG